MKRESLGRRLDLSCFTPVISFPFPQFYFRISFAMGFAVRRTRFDSLDLTLLTVCSRLVCFVTLIKMKREREKNMKGKDGQQEERRTESAGEKKRSMARKSAR